MQLSQFITATKTCPSHDVYVVTLLCYVVSHIITVVCLCMHQLFCPLDNEVCIVTLIHIMIANASDFFLD